MQVEIVKNLLLFSETTTIFFIQIRLYFSFALHFKVIIIIFLVIDRICFVYCVFFFFFFGWVLLISLVSMLWLCLNFCYACT